jgi:hypothetical protein
MLSLTIEPRAVRVPETTKEFLKEHKIPDLGEEFAKPLVAPPPQFSLKANMSPVKNQGSAGTCYAFGCNSALEYSNGRIDLSEGNLTDVVSRSYHGCDCHAGGAIGETMGVCASQGIVSSTDWAYDQTKCCWNPPPNVGGKTHYKFSRIATVFQRPSLEVFEHMRRSLTVEGRFRERSSPGNFVAIIKSCLFNAHVPVVLDVPVWFKSSHHFDAGWDYGPDVHMPTPAQLRLWLEVCVERRDASDPPGIDGWHVIPICGFDDTTARFEFKNSWAWWWGSQGYGTIPYDYITQYSRIGMIGS